MGSYQEDNTPGNNDTQPEDNVTENTEAAEQREEIEDAETRGEQSSPEQFSPEQSTPHPLVLDDQSPENTPEVQFLNSSPSDNINDSVGIVCLLCWKVGLGSEAAGNGKDWTKGELAYSSF